MLESYLPPILLMVLNMVGGLGLGYEISLNVDWYELFH